MKLFKLPALLLTLALSLASTAHAKTLPFAQGVYGALDLIHSEEHDRYFKAQQLLMLTREFTRSPESERLVAEAIKTLKYSASPVKGVPTQTQIADIHTNLGNALVANRAKMNSAFLEESKLVETLLKAQFFHENYDLVKVTYEGIDRDKAAALILAYLTDPRASKYDPEVVPLITGKYMDGSPAKERIVVTIPQGTFEVPSDQLHPGLLKQVEAESRQIVGNLPLNPVFEPLDATRAFVWLEVKGFENIPLAESYLRNILALAHGNTHLLMISEHLNLLANKLETASGEGAIATAESKLAVVVRGMESAFKSRIAASGWKDGGPERIRRIHYTRRAKQILSLMEEAKPGSVGLPPDATKIAQDADAVRKWTVQKSGLVEIGQPALIENIDDAEKVSFINEVPKIATAGEYVEQAKVLAKEAETARALFLGHFEAAKGANLLPADVKTPADFQKWSATHPAKHFIHHTVDGVRLEYYRGVYSNYDEIARSIYAKLEGKVIPAGQPAIDYLFERAKLAETDSVAFDQLRHKIIASHGTKTNLLDQMARKAALRGTREPVLTWNSATKLMSGIIIGYHAWHGYSQYVRAGSDQESKEFIRRKYGVKLLSDFMYTNTFTMEIAVTYDVLAWMSRFVMGEEFPYALPHSEETMTMLWNLVSDLSYRARGTTLFDTDLAKLQDQLGVRTLYQSNGRWLNHDLAKLRKATVDHREGHLDDAALKAAQDEFRKALTMFAGKMSTLIYVLNDRSHNAYEKQLGKYEAKLYEQIVTSEKSFLKGAKRLLLPDAASVEENLGLAELAQQPKP